MVGNKSFSRLFLLFIFITTFLIGCADSETSQKKEIIKIGIAQIVEHPALDASRKGFIDALASKGFKDKENIEIDFQNAQGDIPTAQTIAQNFVSQKKNMILAIATPTAQAAFNATKDIPILITAVTDPAEAGLVKSLEKGDTNVTGTSDMTPIKEQFMLIKKLIPSAKKVGILYNTSETNSEIQVNKAREIAKDFDLEIMTTGVTNVNEIDQGLNDLLERVDVLYVPTDNLMASAMALVSKKSTEKNIPIIGAEKAHVDLGALATEGIDYYKLGFQTGIMAVEVLNGKDPKDMPIETLKDTELIINMQALNKLNISIPEDLKEKATLIKGE